MEVFWEPMGLLVDDQTTVAKQRQVSAVCEIIRHTVPHLLEVYGDNNFTIISRTYLCLHRNAKYGCLWHLNMTGCQDPRAQMQSICK
jgi:hypothetical protein